MEHQIIAVDMDGNLCREVCWTETECELATPNLTMIKTVNELSKKHHIVIYTARKDKLIPATLVWLRKNEVHFDAISNKKMPANVYIDDRAINTNDFDALNELVKD